VIEENGGRGHVTPIPNELGKGLDEEDFNTIKII
jgi:hypothetical protein